MFGLNEVRKLGLGQTGCRASVVNELSDFKFDLGLLDLFAEFWVVADDVMVKNLNGVKGCPGFLGPGAWPGAFQGFAHNVSSVRWLDRCPPRGLLFLS